MKYAKFGRALIGMALCSVVLTACDSDDNNNTVTPTPQPTPTVTTMNMEVGVSLGAIVGADVTVMDLSSGEMVSGVQGTLDADGKVTLELDDSLGPLVVIASGNTGATYFDESANQHLPFAEGQQMRTYIDSVRAQVGITTLTELAAGIIAAAGDNTADTINMVNQQIGVLLAPGVTDITMLPQVVNNLTPGQFTNEQASIYAATLAALATLAEGESAPALNVLLTLQADILDGHIDGRLAELSFENPVYAGGTFLADYLAALNQVVAAYGSADLLAGIEAIFQTSNLSTELSGLTAILSTIDLSSVDLSALPQSTIIDPPVELPSELAGFSGNFKLTTENDGSPYSLNQVVTFAFSTMGAMSLDIDPEQNNGFELVVETFTEVGNEYQWSDTAGGYAYRVSLNNGSVNEINVFNADNAFVGQFEPYQAGSDIENLDLVTKYAGSYQVEAQSGTHNRGTVTIAEDGAVDFDTEIMYGADSIVVIYDRTSIADEPRVQISYGSDDDGPVINLYLTTDLSAIQSIQYRHRNNNVDVVVGVVSGGNDDGNNGSSDTGIWATVNGELQAFSKLQQYIFQEGTSTPVEIPDFATIIAVKEDGSDDGCQQCQNNWSLIMPAVVGTHECQSVVSGQPGSVALALDDKGYNTNGNGFIVPECSITVTEVMENGIKGTFTATLYEVVEGNNVEFAKIEDGQFNVTEQ